MDKVLVGCGAGFAGDRFDGCHAIVEQFSKLSGPRYLIFEVLAERTLAITQQLRRKNPEEGYSPFLSMYLAPILSACKNNGIRIVTNAGAANPRAAAHRIAEMAASQGIKDYRVGLVEGDDLTVAMSDEEILSQERFDETPLEQPVLSANAYLGAGPIVDALSQNADIVITGRCADPALVLAPLIYEFGWGDDDWDNLAAGTLAGHLIECGPQATGATFIDPGAKDAETLNAPGLTATGLATIGFPIAEVERSGRIVITKPDGTGGLVSRATVIEQMLYEIHDPETYVTPDVVLDISGVEVVQIDTDRVQITGAKGKPAPAKLKVTVSFDGGWLGEAELSYAGANSLARARFAKDVLKARLKHLQIDTPVRIDLIGLSSVVDCDSGLLQEQATGLPDGDYRMRVSARSSNRSDVEAINREMLSLWSVGPAGAAGFRETLNPQVFTGSVLIDRHRITPSVTVTGA